MFGLLKSMKPGTQTGPMTSEITDELTEFQPVFNLQAEIQ